MELFKNGYVVAILNTNGKAYDAWPLANISGDAMAKSLTDTADDEWFCVYNMQAIIPDLNFVMMYYNYCKSIDLPVEILLFESLDNSIVTEDEVRIKEVLGFDCIGTVHFSYLQTERNGFEPDLASKNIHINKNGLVNSLEDIMEYINIRRAVIASGVNLEDFWEETPVKISVVDC